jgi:DNA-binding MarR family transcriptional regulator
MKSEEKQMTLRQYQALADFRYELRRFLRYSEQVTRRNGLTPLQYQLLLQIKGYPDRSRATIGALAERLQAKHHGVVALATRCQRLGLISRHTSKDDRRVVYLTLSAKGDRALEHLARWHRDEHRSLRGRLVVDPGDAPLEPIAKAAS